MKRMLFSMMLLAAMAAGGGAAAQSADAVDVLDYDLELDLSQGSPFAGVATLTVMPVGEAAEFELSLKGTVDSMQVAGVIYHDANLAHVPVPSTTEAFAVKVWYHGFNYVESRGWGGFHFDADMSYNLGVAFNENPHVFGRAMFPCRDNFTDKATYTLRVKTRSGWTAQCGGMLQSRTVDDEGCELTVWRIDHPVPTYLVSVSQADYRLIETSVASVGGTYPVTLGYTTQDSAGVQRAFALLDSVVPMYERCLGPYRWGRIGYIATRQGSMEHVNNIALARDFMASTDVRAQSTIAHELGHAWFGNLVTCAAEGDMWINEGGATFCSEIARESTHGRRASNRYYQQNLESVLRYTHLTDGGYLPLHDMPHSLTYGSTTYDKGALVWHSLRGYLGDSLFYASMRRLMASKAFGNIDAAELRDSLSLFSGVALDDFFNFHVFGAGFVDYKAELLPPTLEERVRLKVSQQGVGTDNLVRSGRVPVTFYTYDFVPYKRWIALDGRDTTLAIDASWGLPADDIAFVVLDEDCAISDAATVGVIQISTESMYGEEVTHMRIRSLSLPRSTTVAIEHHWGEPRDLASTPGVVRAASRYWKVCGLWDDMTADSLQGQFRYVRGNYSESDYPNLDRNLFVRQASMDSVVLMYRMDGQSPWEAVSHLRTGNRDEGFFLMPKLKPGEYALAVVDTSLLGMADVEGAQDINLFPNPVKRGGSVTVDVPVDGLFEVIVYDTSGRQVWQKQACTSGESITPNLARGTYLVVIKNNFISLQSNLIQL